MKEVVLPLFKGETICHIGHLKEPLEPSDYNHKDVCGWKSWVASHRHQRAHTEEKPCSHQDCGKTCTSPGGHPGEKIRPSEKVNRRSQCGRDFSECSELVLHQRDHTEEKPYRCDQCGKGFTRSSSLLIHREVHADEKPYKCDKCGKGFTRSSGPLIHHSVHTGEKPHKRDKGGKGFSQSSDLHIHKRVHRKDPH